MFNFTLCIFFSTAVWNSVAFNKTLNNRLRSNYANVYKSSENQTRKIVLNESSSNNNRKNLIIKSGISHFATFRRQIIYLSSEVGQLVAIGACFNWWWLWMSKCHINAGIVLTFDWCGWTQIGRRMMMWHVVERAWIDRWICWYSIWSATVWRMRVWWWLRAGYTVQCICIIITCVWWWRRWMVQGIL